jgi:CHAD domain-containing protein
MHRAMRAPDAESLVGRSVEALARALPAAREGDVAAVHRARVASRRVRAAMPLMGSSAKAHELARVVRRVTRELGPIRELDVSLGILAAEVGDGGGDAGIDRLRASMAAEREWLLASLRERLDDLDFDELHERAVALARRHAGTQGRKAHDADRRRTARRARRLAAAIEDDAARPSRRLHAVRVAAKKLRYTLELQRSVRNAARLRMLRHVQDVLGRTHDLEMMIARARALPCSHGSRLAHLVLRLESECRQLHARYEAARPRLLSLARRLAAAGAARESAA